MNNKKQLGVSRNQKGGNNLVPVNPEPQNARPAPPSRDKQEKRRMNYTQCPDCPTYKKASNCITCYRELQRKHDSLVADLRFTLATSSYYLVSERVRIRLEQEGNCG